MVQDHDDMHEDHDDGEPVGAARRGTVQGRKPDQLGELSKLIEYMAKMLVDMPEAVEVNEIIGENTTVIELKVAKSDLGKIIGKQGRTARAVRTILNGASTKLRKRTVLEIVE
jgi:predicted RNA-binding protein YlqC (UPF0109 family)